MSNTHTEYEELKTIYMENGLYVYKYFDRDTAFKCLIDGTGSYAIVTASEYIGRPRNMKDAVSITLYNKEGETLLSDHYDNSLDMLSSGLTAYKLSTDGTTTIL